MDARGGIRLRVGATERKERLSTSDICLRVAGLMSLLVVVFYLGRPVWWAVEDQLVELYRGSDDLGAKEATGGAAAAADGDRVLLAPGGAAGVAVNPPVIVEGDPAVKDEKPAVGDAVPAVNPSSTEAAENQMTVSAEDLAMRTGQQQVQAEEKPQEQLEHKVQEPPGEKQAKELASLFKTDATAEPAKETSENHESADNKDDGQVLEPAEENKEDEAVGEAEAAPEKKEAGEKEASGAVAGEAVGEVQVAAVENSAEEQGAPGHATTDNPEGQVVEGGAATATVDGGGVEPRTQARPGMDPTPLAQGVRPILHEGRPLLDILKRPIWEKPPPGTPLPSKDEFKLRVEMIETRVKDNVVVVTFANFAFMDFVTNLVRHLTDLGVSNILVGAMDHKILEGLFFEGVPVFDLESGMPDADAGWGTPIFHKMGREKVTLVNIFLGLGYEIFICDTDVVFVRNPLEFVARFPQADILTSSDNLATSVKDESLEVWDRTWGAFNIGILHFRPTDPAKRFAREWAELLHKDDKIWDQNGFNDILRRKLGPAVEGLNNNVFWAYDGTLKMGILPVSIFCSGHTYFVQRLYEVVGLKPYALHATFQFAGTEGKRHRFRESKEFIDPPPYYDPPNGLITFSAKIPQELLSGGQHTVQTHFNLVNYQLKNLRQALAFATIVNRTLVLPEMWCRFERMWYPHNGILEGTVTKQPFLCPFDHVIEVQKMFPGKLAAEEFGPAVDFREYSFLNNPRTPEAVKQSKVQIVLCERGTEGCVPGKQTTPTEGAQAAVLLPKEPHQNEILEVVKPLSQYKLVEVSQIQESFGGWDDQPAGEKFTKRIRHYVGIWCCVAATPGHIYYDFFAADKPGWEPRPPKGWQDDHPAWER